MNSKQLTQIERMLLQGPAGRFTESELDGLPNPVQRYLRTAIAPGTPLARTARIQMKGHIKVGRWIPFRAGEVLNPHQGFIWTARAAGLISGSDCYAQGRGEMDWKLAGLIRVMHAGGPDISQSAAGRAAAEAVWVPTALLPRFDVEWTATDDTHITARYCIDDRPVEIHLRITPQGHVRSVDFDRWGDPDDSGTWGLYPFGGEATAYATFDGVTIPAAGRFGWHYGTDRWNEGEFFRCRITDLTLVTVPTA